MSEYGASPQMMGQFSVLGDDCEVGEGVRIWDLVYVGKGVKIGANVTIGSLAHISDGAVIGDDTQISGSVFLSPSSVIGKGCFIGPGATLTNDRFPPVRRKTGIAAWVGVELEDGVILGANVVVLSGVTIGQRSVVGTGAVVLEDVPPESVVVGSPARVVYSRAEYDRKQQEWSEGKDDGLNDLTGLIGVTMTVPRT